VVFPLIIDGVDSKGLTTEVTDKNGKPIAATVTKRVTDPRNYDLKFYPKNITLFCENFLLK